MSDEPTPKDQTTNDSAEPSGGWVMPEPVFRSSEGRSPKPLTALPADEMDTEMPNLDPLDITLDATDEFANAETDEIVAPPVPDVQPPVPPTTPPKKKGGCAKNVVFVLGGIGVFAAAAIIALVYFLFYARPADSGTF